MEKKRKKDSRSRRAQNLV